jgi:hypothetical protein
MEVWGQATEDGRLVQDGLIVTALVEGKNYAQSSVTNDSYYDVLIVDGDRPLTYNDDPDCAVHNGRGEACVVCIPGYGPQYPGHETDYCIEGPVNGSEIIISIQNISTTPLVLWTLSGNIRQDVILINDNWINFSIPLTPGWNLISLPLIPVDSSVIGIMKGCNYNKIWEFQSDQSWKSTDTGLTAFTVGRGYWVDRVGLSGICTLQIRGTVVNSTTIPITSPWSLVGYPSLSSRHISTFLPSSLYSKIWVFQPDQSWKSTDTGLVAMEPGKGYWIRSVANAQYNITN